MPEVAPQQGAVRLVPLIGTATATAACDAVHLGAVEVFNRGLWGRLGIHSNDFLTAQAACRQLGFPFWSIYVTGSSDPVPPPPGSPRILVWARSITCTGLEAQVVDCAFPAGVLSAETGGGDPPPFAQFDRTDTAHLAVVCRQFEITGAAAGRRALRAAVPLHKTCLWSLVSGPHAW